MKHVIGYLRECYREDNSQVGIWDIFARSVEHPIFVDGAEQLATGLLSDVHLPPQQADQALRRATARKRELQMLYGGLFLVGKAAIRDGDAPRQICAPLLLFPAEIDVEEKGGTAALSIERSGRRLNLELLDLLDEEDVGLADEVEMELSSDVLSEGDVLRITSVLEARVPGLDASQSASWPRLEGRTSLEKAVESVSAESVTWKLVSAAGVALFPQGQGTRGVLTELSEMASESSSELSAPLQALLTEGRLNLPATVRPDRKPTWAPAILSAAQEQILHSARHQPLTVAIGPPGTGKSFTIAALALDHMARGESVLVSSRMDHAVDVVGDKIESSIPQTGLIVRAGRSQYLREIRKWLDELLAGLHTAHPVDPAELETFNRELWRMDTRIRGLENSLQRRRKNHQRWGLALGMAGSSLWSRFQRFRIRRQLGKEEASFSQCLRRWQAGLQERVKLKRQILKISRSLQMQEALRRDRHELLRLTRALGSRSSSRQEMHFKTISFGSIFRAMPIWLVNTTDVHRVLPLQPELFDLAILDEASQCDLASALPILQRAKRVVIAGDPQQLRHLSFLSVQRQARLVQQFSMSESEALAYDYRRTSLLDLVRARITDQGSVGFLNEHYRSQLSIIGFSNREFYRGALHIMTEGGGDDHDVGHAELHLLEGKRDTNGVNHMEANAVLEKVREIMGQHAEEALEDLPSIGILSPFRNQIDRLQKLLESSFSGADWNRLTLGHDLLTGTAHTFQGEERDIMLISLTVDAESNAATLCFLEQPDVFNVSITRARSVQHVFSSRSPETLKADSLLRRYGHYLQEEVKDLGRPSGEKATGEMDWLEESSFSGQVVEALEREGMQVRRSAPLAGMSLDLLVTRDGQKLGIDLIGFPGFTRAMLPMERYRMFYRAQLPIMPLSWPEWEFHRERVLEEIRERLIPELESGDA